MIFREAQAYCRLQDRSLAYCLYCAASFVHGQLYQFRDIFSLERKSAQSGKWWTKFRTDRQDHYNINSGILPIENELVTIKSQINNWPFGCCQWMHHGPMKQKSVGCMMELGKNTPPKSSDNCPWRKDNKKLTVVISIEIVSVIYLVFSWLSPGKQAVGCTSCISFHWFRCILESK
jgi:hypothetical protein